MSLQQLNGLVVESTQGAIDESLASIASPGSKSPTRDSIDGSLRVLRVNAFCLGRLISQATCIQDSSSLPGVDLASEQSISQSVNQSIRQSVVQASRFALTVWCHVQFRLARCNTTPLPIASLVVTLSLLHAQAHE